MELIHIRWSDRDCLLIGPGLFPTRCRPSLSRAHSRICPKARHLLYLPRFRADLLPGFQRRKAGIGCRRSAPERWRSLREPLNGHRFLPPPGSALQLLWYLRQSQHWRLRSQPRPHPGVLWAGPSVLGSSFSVSAFLRCRHGLASGRMRSATQGHRGPLRSRNGAGFLLSHAFYAGGGPRLCWFSQWRAYRRAHLSTTA
jgi:hypothetical protein